MKEHFLKKPERMCENKEISLELVGKNIDEACRYLKDAEKSLISEGFTDIEIIGVGDFDSYREVINGSISEPIDDFEKRLKEWAKEEKSKIERAKLETVQKYERECKELDKLIGK